MLKAVPKFYCYIVILVVISNKECIQHGSVVEQGECGWAFNFKEGQKRESPNKNCVTGTANREFKILGQLWRRRCRLELDFVFFQSSPQLFQLAYFVKCKPSLLELYSYELFISKLRKRKIISLLLVHIPIKCDVKVHVRYFQVIVVQWWQWNVQKSVKHVQSFCFAYSAYRFFDVLVFIIFVAS